MDLGLSNKTAMITGAGRGIGRAAAKTLAAEGANVIAVSRTQAPLDSLLTELKGTAGWHRAIASDLMAEANTTALLDNLANTAPVDIVVHNLGGTLDIKDPFCDVEEWRRMYRLNLEIPIELNRSLVPEMAQRKWGRVVHISSIAAMENQGPVTYCAMKAALTAYTRSIAGVVAKDGVIMTSILPGAVYTEGGYWETAKRSAPDHVKKFVTERMRIGRLGEVEEIASVIAFFCSQHASFAVGSAIPVDGGQGRGYFGQ